MGNLILIGVYFIVLLLIGWFSGRKEEVDDFTIANRQVGIFNSSASLFAVLGGIILVGQASLAFSLGMGAMWFWIGAALGLVILGFATPKIKHVTDINKFLTIGEYFRFKWKKPSGILAAVITFIAFLSLLTAQFVVIGGLLAPLLNLSTSAVILIVGLITLIYLSLGGYRAVIFTDIIQSVLMIVILILIASVVPYGELTSQQLNLFSLDWFSILSFLVLGAFTIMASADIWQRVISAKNQKTAKGALNITAITFVVAGLLMTLIGLAAASAFPTANPDDAFFLGLFELMPKELLGFSIVLVLAAIMSTIDTESFLLSSIASRDFLQKKDTKKVFRVAILTIVAIAALLAIFVSSIITLLFGLMSLIVILSPSIFFSLFWELKDKAVALSLIGGLAGLLVLFVTNNFNPETAVLTFPVALVFLIIGQMFYKNK